MSLVRYLCDPHHHTCAFNRNLTPALILWQMLHIKSHCVLQHKHHLFILLRQHEFLSDIHLAD